jgi:hypothetical protein
MARHSSTRVQPDAAHARVVDPEAQALQGSGQVEPPLAGQVQAGNIPATSAQHRLQDILPQIKELAQKVGGFQRLAEIVQTLAETKE